MSFDAPAFGRRRAVAAAAPGGRCHEIVMNATIARRRPAAKGARGVLRPRMRDARARTRLESTRRASQRAAGANAARRRRPAATPRRY
ncbi:hypothetical protein [Burkholderia multivorans]|uniref:hypothetical protein n=1 Tax=Burkholderia multivorans TaxID=87883 RepID=UPI0021BE422C|nr:hypothetical protein [Burkholderia multivorans]